MSSLVFGIYGPDLSVFVTARRWGSKSCPVAVLALVVLVFLASGCAGQPVTLGEMDQGSYRVARFVGGGTFVAEHDGKHQIRVLGIDKPEIVDSNRLVECGGVAASKQARELLDGQTVEHDVLVSDVWAQTRWVGRQIFLTGVRVSSSVAEPPDSE